MGRFETDTAVERVADNVYRGELVRGWRVGEVPNGGYVLAVAARALREALPHRDPLSVNAFYLAPTGLGPIECRVEVLRRGGGTSFGAVSMYQQGEMKVRVTAAFTDLEKLQGESWSNLVRPDYPAWEDCAPADNPGPEFGRQVELRLVSGGEVFGERRGNGSGEFCAWAGHSDGAEPDAISLLLFADAMPPPVFTLYGPVAWVPTLELTVQVRAHPAPGPLQLRMRSRVLSRGVVEEDGECWDSEGTLVALSRQTAKFRLPPARSSQ